MSWQTLHFLVQPLQYPILSSQWCVLHQSPLNHSSPQFVQMRVLLLMVFSLCGTSACTSACASASAVASASASAACASASAACACASVFCFSFSCCFCYAGMPMFLHLFLFLLLLLLLSAFVLQLLPLLLQAEAAAGRVHDESDCNHLSAGARFWAFVSTWAAMISAVNSTCRAFCFCFSFCFCICFYSKTSTSLSIFAQ